MQGVDLLALDRGLEAEVEVGKGLHGRQPGGTHGGLEPAVVAQIDLGGEELLDRLGGGEAASVDAGEDGVEGLERTGELEVGELGADPVAAAWPLGGRHETPAARRSYSARGRRSMVTRGTEASRRTFSGSRSAGSASEW